MCPTDIEVIVRRTFQVALIAANIFPQCPIFANTKADDLGGPLTLSGEMIAQGVNGNEKVLNGIANITLNAELSNNVRAVLLLRIQQSLIGQGIEAQKIESLLSEAYIQIDNVGGKHVAFVIGKQAIPFGNLQSSIINEELDPIDKISNQSEVIGFTIQLEETGFFELIEASVFETREGDLSIGHIDGASVRITKEITEQLSLVASSMVKGQGTSSDDLRQSVGFVFATGKWTMWAEGVHMVGNNNYPNSRWMAHGGTEFKVNDRQRVVVTSTFVSQAMTRIGVAYEIEVVKDTYVAPELALIVTPDGKREWQAVLRTEIRFRTK